MVDKSTGDRRMMYLAGGLGLAGMGLGLGLRAYRQPLAVLEWMVRRTLLFEGLKQQVLPYRKGQLSYFHKSCKAGRGRPVVVLVHGLGGHGGNWFQTVKCLRDRDLVIVDLPGHGDSQIEGLVWTSESIFEIFTLLVDEATKGRPMVLVGNSMGGWVSILYALAFPERIAQLVLVNSAGQFFDIAAQRHYFVPETRAHAQRIVDAVFGKNAPRLPGFLLDAMVRKAAASPSATALEHAAQARFIDEHLGALDVPTDVIWGTEDTMLPIAHAHQFEEKIPDVRLHLMPGAGHSPQVGSPREFNEVLRRALR
jgi:abhydrolase domain-containing protein 6